MGLFPFLFFVFSELFVFSRSSVNVFLGSLTTYIYSFFLFYGFFVFYVFWGFFLFGWRKESSADRVETRQFCSLIKNESKHTLVTGASKKG